MAAIQPCADSHLLKKTDLYLTCVAEDVTVYTIKGCNCISVKTSECHVSFIDKIGHRRNILLCADDHNIEKVKLLASPIWIRATNFCDFEVKYATSMVI